MNKPAISKLFKLNKWLTLPKAAHHLSVVFEEDITEADILRLALDEYLKLSVNFNQYVAVKEVFIESLNEPRVELINGVWDLPLIGGEKVKIENCLKELGERPLSENIGSIDGVFIERGNKFYKLQNSYLPEDSVLVVRTQALRDFEQSISDNEEEKEEVNNVTTKPHGNTEHFAQNREQVLGAALSVLARWPTECCNASKKIEATKIRELIENKGYLFWNIDGEPPLSTQEIEKLLRKWLNKTRD